MKHRSDFVLRAGRCLSVAASLAIAAVAVGAADAPKEPAVVADGSVTTASGATALFVVTTVEDRNVSNALGFGVLPRPVRPGETALAPVERSVPSGKVSLGLLARRAGAAPSAAEVMEPERLYAVMGEVTVELRPGVRYRVAGVLEPHRRELWVEEAATGQLVGKKVIDSPNEIQRAEAAAADRYACCNLRISGGWIGDGNAVALPFVPVGAHVKVTGFGRNRVHVNVEGRPASAGIDSPAVRPREELAELLFVKADPRLALAAMPPFVQSAIFAGRVARGMTREQVIMALGYPRRDRTPRLEDSRWIYFVSDNEEFDLDFGADDRVQAINATTRTKQIVWMAP